MASTKPKTADFASDPKMKFNEQTGKWSYVGEDDVSYEYDEAMGAWFPMYDEKLMQAQASVYAVDGVDENVTIKPKEKKKRAATYDTAADPDVKKQKKEPVKKPVTSVYVTGIPFDTTVEELKTVFSKCGVIMEDLETGEPKIKIYRDDRGNIKGDALVSYFKEESVPLAIDLLDDSELRPGVNGTKINVQKAVFKEKEQPAEKKKSTAAKTKVKRKIQQLQRKFDWVDEETGKKQEKFAKIVILKNMYTQEELDADPTLLLELKEDVRDECEKLGEVTNVILYDVSCISLPGTMLK
ncbi:hypothetical protein EDC96DRAFT_20206 [Choanephora cucurbitarum]|nr:hypothetical protein EDC96DRAFT_20206 [Choanephora cucurbitarum]